MRNVFLCLLVRFSLSVSILMSITALGQKITYVERSADVITQEPVPIKKLNRRTVAQALRVVVPQYSNRSEDGILIEVDPVQGVNPDSLRKKFPSYAIPEILGWTTIRSDDGKGSIVQLTELGRKVLEEKPTRGVERLRPTKFFLLKFHREMYQVGPIRNYGNGEALVNFTWVRKPSALLLRAVKQEGPFHGQARFERFDDGWRIQKIEGRLQVALQSPNRD